MIAASRLAGIGLALFFATQSPAFGQADPAQMDPAQAAWDAAAAALVTGPSDIPLRDQAVMKLPEGFGYVPVAEGAALMETMGNATDERFLGLIFPLADEAGWFVSLDFEESGYIRDDDAKEWDTEELLQSLRDGTEEANEMRAQHGVPPLEVVGWVEAPAYDATTHQLVWSLSARDKGTNPPSEEMTVNYNTYVLGREGYISLNLITSMATVEAEKPIAHQLLASVGFVNGKRYQDFNASTDRVAEYGLAALIGGVAAKKLGLFGLIAVFLAKTWKLLLLGFVAVGSFARKFFSRKPAPEAQVAEGNEG